MENWLLNWTSWVMRNTHVEIDGLTYDDGPEWFEKMFECWKNNSDYGKKLKIKSYENFSVGP
jgi:hypothetical protein